MDGLNRKGRKDRKTGTMEIEIFHRRETEKTEGLTRGAFVLLSHSSIINRQSLPLLFKIQNPTFKISLPLPHTKKAGFGPAILWCVEKSEKV